MAFSSAKNLIASVAEASPSQFDGWQKSWRLAADGGSPEPLLSFVARERGVSEDVLHVCRREIRIDAAGPVQSLNVAQAAAVLLAAFTASA